MQYDDFMKSLEFEVSPEGLSDALHALWLDAQGDWDKAHKTVQNNYDSSSARVHAYLHRKEGDDWNARYWHNQAGSDFPSDMTLQEEWQMLVRSLTS